LQADQTYRAKVREIQTNSNTQIPTNVMVLSLGTQISGGLPAMEPGSVLEISTATTPDLKGAKVAIGGGPALLKEGKPFPGVPPPGLSQSFSERSKYERHPRTAIGWSPTHFYLVVVDGRQPGLSVGMKLSELAEHFKKLGCTDAMNLDGGKSAQMWLSGEIKNSPCQGEDTVANSLFVVRKPPAP
jgi:exopolysaccharide biosynthesis protein